jgi:hypothetical protein
MRTLIQQLCRKLDCGCNELDNADRLALAAERVMLALNNPDLAERDRRLLQDLLRSRLYTYSLARDGEEGARRFRRSILVH